MVASFRLGCCGSVVEVNTKARRCLFSNVFASFGAMYGLLDHVARDTPVDGLANGQRRGDNGDPMSLVSILIGNTHVVNNIERTVVPAGPVVRRYREMNLARVHVRKIPQEQRRFTGHESTAFGPEHCFHQLAVPVERHGYDAVDPLRPSFKHTGRSQTAHLLIANIYRGRLLDREQPVLRHGYFQKSSKCYSHAKPSLIDTVLHS
jgi:hypothetical protein